MTSAVDEKIPHQWEKTSEEGELIAWLVIYQVKCRVCGLKGNVAQHRINTGSGDCQGPDSRRKTNKK